jgi:hypothetical protein
MWQAPETIHGAMMRMRIDIAYSNCWSLDRTVDPGCRGTRTTEAKSSSRRANSPANSAKDLTGTESASSGMTYFSVTVGSTFRIRRSRVVPPVVRWWARDLAPVGASRNTRNRNCVTSLSSSALNSAVSSPVVQRVTLDPYGRSPSILVRNLTLPQIGTRILKSLFAAAFCSGSLACRAVNPADPSIRTARNGMLRIAMMNAVVVMMGLSR